MSSNEADNQSYDHLLKRLVEHQPTIVIPLLFPRVAAEVLEELNVEVLLPPRRIDRVYRARSSAQKKEVIIHIEFEVSANHDMDKRLLIYNALLMEKHGLPVRSMIVYPFKVSTVKSPLISAHEDDEIIRFRYTTLPLWKLDARTYIEKQAIPLYGLLPAMQGTSAALLLHAIEQMIEWYHDDEAHLRDELMCFRVLLTRARRLPEAEFLPVERRIRMFDLFLEEDPWIKERIAQGILKKQGEWETQGILKGRAEGRAEGQAEGRAEGIVQSSRQILVTVVQTRFPSLGEVAELTAAQLADYDVLQALIEQIVRATGEHEARQVLEGQTASQKPRKQP